TRRSRPLRPRLHRRARQLEATASDSASEAELVVVNLITQHHVEQGEQAAGEGALRFVPAAPPEDGEVDAFESCFAAGRERSRLAEHPAQERAALLADIPPPVLVRRRAKGGGQPA